MKLVDKITVSELREMASTMYGTLVKAVVDIKKEILVVDAELHADQEKYLLENGSDQNDLWGINLYPEDVGTENFIEFDSMINIRPRKGNRSRDVEDDALRKDIIRIVNAKVKHE